MFRAVKKLIECDCQLQVLNVRLATDSAVFRQDVDASLSAGSATETTTVETVRTKTLNIVVSRCSVLRKYELLNCLQVTVTLPVYVLGYE